MNWKEHKKKLMENPEFVNEYSTLEPEYKLAADLIRLRLAKGLTQEDLAKLLNTKQESIARLENGGSLPSLSTMKKLAEALDAELEINLRPKHAIQSG
jgi:transcriptional regulator with XRE-family HTH domain